MFCEEVEGWQRNPKTGKELDKYNHAMSAWRYGISNAEVFEGKRRAMVEKRALAKQRAGENGSRRVIAPKRAQFNPESGEVVFGSVASRGGTQVDLDPRFTLNVGRENG